MIPEERVFESPEALEAYGRELVGRLSRGSVVLLIGPMGAGKTTLTRGIAVGLGFAGEVTSPTYTCIHEYPTPQGALVHCDAYRLEDARKLLFMGLEELIEGARLTVIEWGEGLRDELEHPVLIRLEPFGEGRKLGLESI